MSLHKDATLIPSSDFCAVRKINKIILARVTVSHVLQRKLEKKRDPQSIVFY